MKNTKLIILISTLFLLVGCNQIENNNNFSKKEKCLTYLPLIQEKVEIDKNLGTDPTQPIVFYSPKLDTCIGAYTNQISSDSTTLFYMYDLLTNEVVYNEKMTPEDDFSVWDAYDEKKDELQRN